MKFFVCSDIHSFFTPWMKALREAGYDRNNPEHILVVCGDLMDRGDETVECLKFVNSIPEDKKILIRGNHEELLQDVIKRHQFGNHDFHNGTNKTFAHIYLDMHPNANLEDKISVFDFVDEVATYDGLKEYYNSLKDYFETKKYVFVHGWIPALNRFTEDWRKGDWGSSMWENGMELWDQGYKLKNKTICCGHWHSSWGHHWLHNNGPEFGDGAIFDPFIDDGIIALDACTALSNKVNVVVLEDDFI